MSKVTTTQKIAAFLILLGILLIFISIWTTGWLVIRLSVTGVLLILLGSPNIHKK